MITTSVPAHLLTFTRTIQAPVEQVWQSFVNRDDLCDWLCYNALLDVRENGHIFVTWYDGQHPQRFAGGVFKQVVENEKLVFSWLDPHYATPTEVTVTVAENADGVTVDLTHTGFAETTPEETIAHYQQFWDVHLDNLKSILETGANKRIVDRVAMGFYPGPLTEEVAQALGVPVTQGVRVNRVLPDYSAAAAGIQADDVLVRVDNESLNDVRDIRQININRRPGDVVSVEFYRGAEKHQVDVTLQGYPIPPTPDNYEQMAQTHTKNYAEANERLEALLTGITPQAAERRLNATQNNVKESLASLILEQRHTLQYYASYAQGPRIISAFPRNQPWRNAIIETFGSAGALLEELRRAQQETIAVLRAMPEDNLARKNYIWWMNFETHFLPLIYDQQINLIKQTLESAA
jgi:uncharacterized protein YndB with AHSA1/START domain